MQLKKSLWLAIAASAAPAYVFASGLELTQHGAKELGQGYAGTATMLEDASAIAYNPAGLVLLEKSQFSGGVTLLHAKLDYDVRVNSEKLETKYGLPAREVAGPGAGESKELSPVPHLFYSQKVNPDTAIGLGIYVPFASGSKFPAGWAGRYHSEETSQKAININPVMSVRLNPQLSLGMGFIAQIYQARLTNQIDLGYLVVESILTKVEETSGPSAAVAAAPTLLNNYGSNPDYQVTNEMDLSSLAYGFNLGLLWQPADALRFGLNYRSQVAHVAKGEASRPTLEQPNFKTDLIAAVAGDAGMSVAEATSTLEKAFDERGALGGDLVSDVILPQLLTVSAQWQPLKQLALMASATWTDWSVFKEMRLEYADDSLRGGADITGSGDDVRRRDLVQPLKFEDSLRYGVGVRYQPIDALKLRAGMSLDNTPITNADYRTPRGPDSDRKIYGVGASYQLTKGLGVDLAYGLIQMEKAPVNARENPAGTQHRAEGHSEGLLTNVAVQVNYQF